MGLAGRERGDTKQWRGKDKKEIVGMQLIRLLKLKKSPKHGNGQSPCRVTAWARGTHSKMAE